MILDMYLARILRPASGYRIHTVAATRNRAEMPGVARARPRIRASELDRVHHSGLQDMSLQPRGTKRPGGPCISAPKEGVGNAGCPVHPQPRVRSGSARCTRVFTAVAPEITRRPRTQWF